MQNRQTYIDELLDRQYVLPVQTDPQGPLPDSNSAYGPIRAIVRSGFAITPREFIQAIGCKTACVPDNDLDKCLRNALKYVRLLDLESGVLRFKVIPESDLRTALSNEIGIGMTCLIASKCFGIPWDQISSIPGPGKRADFRGHANNLRYIFEAKGTRFRNKQSTQIADGIDQKNAHIKRGEQFDVGLVISTYIGKNTEGPRILLADPEPYEQNLLFGSQSNIYFRYRHFVRVLQYIGDTPLAKKLYLKSFDIMRGEPPQETMPWKLRDHKSGLRRWL